MTNEVENLQLAIQMWKPCCFFGRMVLAGTIVETWLMLLSFVFLWKQCCYTPAMVILMLQVKPFHSQVQSTPVTTRCLGSTEPYHDITDSWNTFSTAGAYSIIARAMCPSGPYSRANVGLKYMCFEPNVKLLQEAQFWGHHKNNGTHITIVCVIEGISVFYFKVSQVAVRCVKEKLLGDNIARFPLKIFGVQTRTVL